MQSTACGCGHYLSRKREMIEPVDITRGLQLRLQAFRTQSPTPTECEDIRNTSFALFKETNVNNDLSAEDCNNLISLVVELTKSDQALKSFEVIVEAWKFYMKILKAHSTILTANTCNEVSDILTKCASEGISTFLTQPSDPGLSFLFFYLQRISATLSYCVHVLAESKAIDMIYLLCAARGILELPVALSSSLSMEMKTKMETNFLKAMTSANEVNQTQRTDEVNIFRRAMEISETQSGWSYLPRLSLCRSLGACRLSLYATSQSLIYFRTNITFLETLVALLADACCHQFEAPSDHAFQSIINDIANKYALMLCDNKNTVDSNRISTKEFLLELLVSYQNAAGTGLNLRGQLFELMVTSIVFQLDEKSQRSMLSICQKILHSYPCESWFNLLKSLLLTVRSNVSMGVIREYAKNEISGAVSHQSIIHDKFISSCLCGSAAYDTFVNTVTSSSSSSSSSSSFPSTVVEGMNKVRGAKERLFVQLMSLKHFPKTLRHKINLQNCEDLLNKTIVLTHYLMSVVDRIKMDDCPLPLTVGQKIDLFTYSPNKLCFLDALIALDTLYKLTMAVTSQSTNTSSNDAKAFIDKIINVCEVLASICTICFAHARRVSSLFQRSNDPPSTSIQTEMDTSIKISISACDYLRDILLSIVKSEFEDKQLETLKKVFEIPSSYLFPETAMIDRNGGQNVDVSQMDQYLSRLYIIFLDCCYEFAENLQPKLHAHATSLFSTRVLSMIKARNKERKGKGENVFIKSSVNIQRKIMATICTGTSPIQGYGDDNISKRMKHHY